MTVLVDGCAAEHDFAIGKRQGAALCQDKRRTFSRVLHRIRFIDQQHAHVMAPKVLGARLAMTRLPPGNRRCKRVFRPDSSASADNRPRRTGIFSKMGSRSETTASRQSLSVGISSSIGAGSLAMKLPIAAESRGRIADAHRFDDGNPFNGRISDRIRDCRLEGP